MAEIMVLHGPNLNLLGTREPEIYGSRTLADINASLSEQVSLSGNLSEKGAPHKLTCHQSNAESELIDHIHAANGRVNFIIINPGAFTHTSIALRDALLSVAIPFIEVHLSNVFSREDFRKHSYLSDIAVGCISGLGALGYNLAMQYALSFPGDTANR